MSKDRRVPVIINGEKVGDISLATEYRILLEGMILSAEADIQFYRKRLKELDAAGIEEAE